MAFVLRGEIEIDGRKGTAVLKGIQREAKATSRSFDQSGRSASSLAKSLLSINSQASATSKALQLIGRTGGLGLFGAGAVKGGIALGDALTRIAGEAEASGKSLDKAFRAGLAATTPEGVQSSIENITSEIDRLQKKTEGFSLPRAINRAFESIFKTDLGLAPEEGLIAAGEAEVKLLKVEKERLSTISNLIKLQSQQLSVVDQSQKDEVLSFKILQAKNPAQAKFLSGKSEEISLAEQVVTQEAYTLNLLKIQDKELRSIADRTKDIEIINRSQNSITEQNIKLKQAQLSLIKLQAAEQKKAQQESFQRGGEGAGFLLQGRAGEQALTVARKRQQIETTRENFRLREATLADLAKKASAEEGITLTKQDIRKRLAAQQAAAEMPSMAQKVMAQEAGISPEMVAAGGRAQKGTRGMGPKESFGGVFESLKKSIDDLSKKIPAAVPQ
jgi:hypothetical protein